MRGSRSQGWRQMAILRIIPAHAGLTASRYCLRPVSLDHPRACGAHSVLARKAAAEVGSSPRMRGSPVTKDNGCVTEGIIPAHAGLTLMSCHTHSAHWDHPRACGAHCVVFRNELIHEGSSPRMRGSRRLNRFFDVVFGIIPAHAGLTCRSDF